MRLMKRYSFLALAALCAACQVPTTQANPPVLVEVTIEAPVIPSATPACQPASGVTVEILPYSFNGVGIHITGLRPGESPTILWFTSTVGVGSKGGTAGPFAQGADSNGEFTTSINSLDPLPGQTHANWDIRVVHRRGVACASITLP